VWERGKVRVRAGLRRVYCGQSYRVRVRVRVRVHCPEL
jgi:hypothetical protein